MNAVRILTGEERAGCLIGTMALAGVVMITVALAQASLLAAGCFLLATALLASVRRRRRLERRRAQRRHHGRGGWQLGSGRLPRTWWQPVAMARHALESYRGSVALLDAGPTRERLDSGVLTLLREAEGCEALARRGADLDRQLARVTRRRGTPLPTALDAEAAGLRGQVIDAHAELVRSAETMQRIALRAGQVVLATTLSDRDELLRGIDDLARDLQSVADAVGDVRRQAPPAAPQDPPLQRAEG